MNASEAVGLHAAATSSRQTGPDWYHAQGGALLCCTSLDTLPGMGIATSCKFLGIGHPLLIS